MEEECGHVANVGFSALGIHTNRVAGCDYHHWHAYGADVASNTDSERGIQSSNLCEQHYGSWLLLLLTTNPPIALIHRDT